MKVTLAIHLVAGSGLGIRVRKEGWRTRPACLQHGPALFTVCLHHVYSMALPRACAQRRRKRKRRRKRTNARGATKGAQRNSPAAHGRTHKSKPGRTKACRDAQKRLWLGVLQFYHKGKMPGCVWWNVCRDLALPCSVTSLCQAKGLLQGPDASQ